MTTAEVRSYPSTVSLGGQELTLRYMKRGDEPAVLAFARALQQHDLMFLRRDITREADVADWAESVERDHATTIIAFAGETMVGYATVDWSELNWSRHVAELRVLVAESMRGKGLGTVLTQEAFAISLARGVEKMVAQMTLDQKGAIAVFEGLGFRPEALLRDHVKDRDGTKHDLLVLSHDVGRFQSQMAAYGVSEALGF